MNSILPPTTDTQDEDRRAVQLLLAAARGLVVIDPNNADDVRRLVDWYNASYAALRRVQPEGQAGVQNGDMMAWALRKYADPRARFRPDEPTGVGAVVEDAKGNIFVRHVVVANATPWRLTDQDWRSWEQIDSIVAVHSWGAPIEQTVRPSEDT